MENPTSDIFSISPHTYAKARARKYAGAWAVALVLPVIAAVIAGFYDMRWWFVGLIVLFIIYPMVLTMAWFSLTGSPSMALLLRPQRCTFRRDRKVDIEFFHFDTEENPEPADRITVAISDADAGSRYITLKASPGQRLGLILIPVSQMPPEYLNLYSE